MVLQDFDELLNIAEQGDHRNVDMLVGDIYGGMYNGLNLPADLIASSFGKAARSSSDRDSKFITLVKYYSVVVYVMNLTQPLSL